MPTHFVKGLVLNVAVAAATLAAGACLVAAGIAWAPSRGDAQAAFRGGQLYAAECASCHGARLEGSAARTQPDAWAPPPAPPLDASGHAWQHADAELTAIVARGARSLDAPGGTSGMPSFAERLDRGEIDDILAYVKSRWPASARAYQASLTPGREEILADVLRNPAWVFPGQCLSPPNPQQSSDAGGPSG